MSPREVTTPLAGLSVLVVEDDYDSRVLIVNVLESHGAEVTMAADADAGAALARRLRPRVLISHIGMPGKNGYELVRELRSLPEAEGGRIPAIALSRFAPHQDLEKSAAAGFDLHLSEPLDIAELVLGVGRLARS